MDGDRGSTSLRATHVTDMKTSDPKAPPKATPEPTAKQAREQRLAKALRDNLRRRKAIKSPSRQSENQD